MPSPFLGMDPFLEEESLWPWFQHQMVITLEQMISVLVADRYSVRISERRYHDAGHEHCEEYLTIHDGPDGHLVTLFDIVSPANKLTETGRAAFLASRQEARESRANIIEVDLVLRGQPIMDYGRDGLPEWDYAVTVTRATQPERHEIYCGLLEKRLPRFRVPLAANDRDGVVDLQEAFRRAFEDCGFDDRIDYNQDPGVLLSAEILERIGQILREKSSG